MTTKTISVERLRALLDYDPATGIFRWRVRQRKIGGFYNPGDIAGFKETLGYWCVGLGGKTYKGHRLAWLYVKGEWPAEDIDHINGRRSDNRICNLRLGGKAVNAWNAKMKVTNAVGLKGVRRDGKKFIARIGVRGVRIYLGTFDTAELAHSAYMNAAIKYFGEFARAA